MINLSLITTAIKIFLKEIERFRNRLVSSQRILITIEIDQSLVSFVFIERQTTFSTRVLSVNRSISKEDSFFVLLNITQESSFLFRDTKEKIIFESRFENSKFSELSASSRKSEITLLETKNISSKNLSSHQKNDRDLIRVLLVQTSVSDDRLTYQTLIRVHLTSQTLSLQISSDDYRLSHQTSLRVQSNHQVARVQSKTHLFQFFHLTNLRKLFITQSFTLFTTISSETLINSTAETILSREYLANASSIVFRQYNIQSLQKLIQRNFDFLDSILSRVINLQFDSAESFSDITSQNLSNSISASLESNREESSQNNITIQKKSASFISFTTSFLKNQVNFFLSFSTLSFDSLFHQFRSSFSSNSFTSSLKSILFSKLSANLHIDFDFSRIEKLNDCTSEKISSEISSNLVTIDSHSTKITSVMSTFEKNVSSSSVFYLTQQNIQEIALFMFNLFAQNVQDQTQARTTKTINETIISIAKKNVFRAFDVEFFDSQLNSSYDQDDVVQIKRDLYYKNVYLFVERVKNAVIMSETETVRTNLSTCLRESAQI